MSNANEDLVREFCAAWSQLDADVVLAYFTDDAVWHNMPSPEPAVGHDGIRALIDMFVPGAESIEFELHAVASAGDLVFTERTDRFVNSGKTIALPVAGVFEIRDGKIAAWRDYFDMQVFITQMA